ncbi:MAG: PaaI family thioesterase [Actinomycetota bacterium]
MATPDTPAETESPPFFDIPPNRLIGRGHAAGDFLEAYEWEVVEESPGRLVLDVHLPVHACNPLGQLFGGFTPTYIDLVSLLATRAGPDRLNPDVDRHWLSTLNMRIDYYEPVVGPRFQVEATVEHRRGRTYLVTTKMRQEGTLAVFALTTLRSQDLVIPA